MATDIAQFHNPKLDMAYKIISVILNFIIVACVTWYNNDYTPQASEGTGLTRQLKAEGKDDYVGDYFFEEADDEDEEDI